MCHLLAIYIIRAHGGISLRWYHTPQLFPGNAMSMCPEIRNVADADTDLTELELPETMKTEFPDPTDVLNFTLTITPDEG